MARRRKGLSDEDRAVWGKVAETVTPRHRPAPTTDDASDARPPDPKPARPRVEQIDIRPPAAPRIETRLAPSVADRVNSAPVRMHHGLHKKMVKGKLSPEARLDLHGMTLARAHPLLTRFIMDAHDRGMRLVLVITGKGRDVDDGGPIPIRRGVLRHQVPSWLTAPPLGAFVLDIRTAHLKHGGEGAYYVYLKRNR
ncbi:DNA mismatch repair protein MutS [Rhodobacterales bacterium HKCCE3408]|nr:DNA mismatch repair protein MutS [Rhodobacterales bacterium HKCCE3408]